MNLELLLKILGLVFIALAAAKVPDLPRLSWGWLGVLLIGLVVLF